MSSNLDRLMQGIGLGFREFRGLGVEGFRESRALTWENLGLGSLVAYVSEPPVVAPQAVFSMERTRRGSKHQPQLGAAFLCGVTRSF